MAEVEDAILLMTVCKNIDPSFWEIETALLRACAQRDTNRFSLSELTLRSLSPGWGCKGGQSGWVGGTPVWRQRPGCNGEGWELESYGFAEPWWPQRVNSRNYSAPSPASVIADVEFQSKWETVLGPGLSRKTTLLPLIWGEGEGLGVRVTIEGGRHYRFYSP